MQLWIKFKFNLLYKKDFPRGNQKEQEESIYMFAGLILFLTTSLVSTSVDTVVSQITTFNNNESCIKEIKFNVSLNKSEIHTYHKYLKRYSKDDELKRNYLKHKDDYLWIRDQLMINNLPPDLVYIIVVESTMNPKLRSGSYHGIWQMSKYHCKGNDVNCLYSYRASTKYAIKYLLELKEIFHNDHRKMIYGYNCGYGKILGIMKRNHGNVPFHKLPLVTRMYIPKMMAAKHVLEHIFPAAGFRGCKYEQR